MSGALAILLYECASDVVNNQLQVKLLDEQPNLNVMSEERELKHDERGGKKPCIIFGKVLMNSPLFFPNLHITKCKLPKH